MQAIQTTYKNATNTRGAYIKASCAAKTIKFYDESDSSPEAVHANAAQELARQLGWTKDYHGAMYGGCLPDGSYAWVFDNKQSPYTFACAPVK
jgi:hypothetical protein